MENNTISTNVEDIKTTEVVEVQPKKEKKKVVKSRNYEELKEAGIRGMSDAEKAKLIEGLKEELAVAKHHAESYAVNAEKSYEQSRQMREDIENYKAEMNRKLQFCVNAITHANDAIMMALK